MKLLLLIGVALFGCVSCGEVYFEDNFDQYESIEDVHKNWIVSKHDDKNFGKFELTKGKFWGDENNKGIRTSEDAHFYAVSTKFEDKKFTNDHKTLVLQFSVKHEQNIDCGGGYLKLFGCDLEEEKLHGDSPYLVMFGPDICGPGTKKVHVIFSYKGKNHLINREIRCKDDIYTHVYTLVVEADQTYKVLIDGDEAQKGSLEEDWSFLPPKMIKDPEAKKPEDWDDRAQIDDEADTKPEDWDQPETIADPSATKPDDWDDEMDGEWEAPMIDNPAFKGEWKPKQIDNPAYKGAWVHPEISNPEYTHDSEIYKYEEVCGVGLDLWQVKAGTIFDNFLVTDDEAIAKEKRDAILKNNEDEKKMKETQEAEEEEKRKKEESEKKAEDETNEDDEADDEKDDDAEEPARDEL